MCKMSKTKLTLTDDDVCAAFDQLFIKIVQDANLSQCLAFALAMVTEVCLFRHGDQHHYFLFSQTPRRRSTLP